MAAMFAGADACTRNVITLSEDQTVDEVHDITATHQGFPIIDAAGRLIGVLTRRDFMDRAPDTPRLPVVDRDDPSRLVGIITRSDLLKVHARRLEEEHG